MVYICKVVHCVVHESEVTVKQITVIILTTISGIRIKWSALKQQKTKKKQNSTLITSNNVVGKRVTTIQTKTSFNHSLSNPCKALDVKMR